MDEEERKAKLMKGDLKEFDVEHTVTVRLNIIAEHEDCIQDKVNNLVIAQYVDGKPRELGEDIELLDYEFSNFTIK